MSSALASVTAESSTVERKRIRKETDVTAADLRIASLGMLLPKREVTFFCETDESAEENSTVMVTVLMPPAVPAGDPPINIRSRQTKAPALERFCCGMVANPAVRVVTDWNSDT